MAQAHDELTNDLSLQLWSIQLQSRLFDFMDIFEV